MIIDIRSKGELDRDMIASACKCHPTEIVISAEQAVDILKLTRPMLLDGNPAEQIESVFPGVKFTITW